MFVILYLFSFFLTLSFSIRNFELGLVSSVVIIIFVLLQDMFIVYPHVCKPVVQRNDQTKCENIDIM